MAERYVIVRGNQSGCFAGVFASRDGTAVMLNQCRRLWYWDGAATLSQLAVEGTSKPEQCKFPQPTIAHTILDAIEIIDCTETARVSIEGVKAWRA